MGTDIHGVFQRYDERERNWYDVGYINWPEDRHYQLFAVLAGVRNGYGFAGVITGEVVPPIAPRRGLPPDFEMDYHDHPTSPECMAPDRREWWLADHPLEGRTAPDGIDAYKTSYWYADPSSIVANDCGIWMGDHSWSWLTGEEMLAWFETAPVVVQTGVVPRAVYEQWDKLTRPKEYYAGISGPNIRVIPEAYVGKLDIKYTDVQVTWEQPLKEELGYFFAEIQRMQDQYGKIRYVFGFDS